MNVGPFSTNTWSGQLRKRVEPGFGWFESNKIFWFITPSFCTILLEHKHTTTFSCSALISFSLILASSQIFTWDDWVMTQAMIRRWKSSPIGGNLNRHHLLFYPSFVEIVRSSVWKLLRLTFLRIWVLRQVVAPLYCYGSPSLPPCISGNVYQNQKHEEIKLSPHSIKCLNQNAGQNWK